MIVACLGPMAIAATPTFVFHQGVVTADGGVEWDVRWVGVPPDVCRLAVPMPAETVALPPTSAASLIRDDRQRVVAIVRRGQAEIGLRVPATPARLVPPLWVGDHAQRVVVRGSDFRLAQPVTLPEPHHVEMLDRLGPPVSGSEFVVHLVSDDALVASGGLLGDVRPGGPIVWSLAWIGVSMGASVVGMLSLTRRHRRRASDGLR